RRRQRCSRLRGLLGGLVTGAQISLGSEHASVDDADGSLFFGHGNVKFYQPSGDCRAPRLRVVRCAAPHRAGDRNGLSSRTKRGTADGYDPGVSEAFDRLTALVARLRRDCPWDREQSFETLKTFLLEETYEVLAAMDEGDQEKLREELGDLLFQVFFLSRL